MIGRGRNGEFKPRKILVTSTPSDVGVFVYSNRIGKEAPLFLRGTRKEMHDCFGRVYEALTVLDEGETIRVPMSGRPRRIQSGEFGSSIRKIRLRKER